MRRPPLAPSVAPHRDDLDEVVDRLHATYGSPRHGNKDDPLDELVYIILSNRTRQAVAQAGFDLLRDTFGSWRAVARAAPDEVAATIHHLGLARLKAGQLVTIFRRLEIEFGAVTLDPLRSFPADEAEAFLLALPGVSKKVAKCVLMYSLSLPVLPVDVHVHRVAARLGGIPVKKRPDTSQDAIEEAVPEGLRYRFHVNALAHGREYCTPRRPRCGGCCVRERCETYRRSGPEGDSREAGRR